MSLICDRTGCVSNPAAGWYPDPNDPLFERYWDGRAWTEQVDEVLVAEVAAPLPQYRATVSVTPSEQRPTPTATLVAGSSRWWQSRWAMAGGALVVVLALAGAFVQARDGTEPFEEAAEPAVGIDEEVAGPVVQTTATTAVAQTEASAPIATEAPEAKLPGEEGELSVQDEFAGSTVRQTLEEEGYDASTVTDEQAATIGSAACVLADSVSSVAALNSSILIEIPDDAPFEDEFYIGLARAAMGVYCPDELQALS